MIGAGRVAALASLAGLLGLASWPGPAAAQVAAVLEREAGGLGGVPVTVPGVAAAEEATAMAVNPAGLSLLGGQQIAWQHESGLTPGSRGDALFVGQPFGAVGLGLGLEWIRPGHPGGGDRWRKTTFGLALGGPVLGLGVNWNWYASPDRAIDHAESWDAGLVLRPWRHVSLGLSAMNRDLRVGGARLPIRYDAGLGVRVWRDSLTLTADLVGDDDRKDGLRATHAAVGVGLEHPSGVGLSGQLQVPIRDGVPGGTLGVFAVTWNGGHAGLSAGGHPGSGWLGGARLSTERYPSATPLRRVPALDVDRELEPRTFLVWEIGDRDRWGALLEKLSRLRDDPEVGGLILKLPGSLDLGGGRAEELRQAVAGVAARHPVLAYLDGGDTRGYWVASAATAVAAVPGSTLFVTGLGRSRLYFKDALARLGIAVEVVKVGAYKSATEPLVRMESSPEAREAEDALLDDVYGRLVGDLAAGRKLAPERVRALLAQGVFTAEDAKEAGLVDAVLWPDELEAWARARTGARASLGAYVPPLDRVARRWGPRPVVEVVRVEGTIAKGRTRKVSGAGLAGSESVCADLRRAAEDPAVRAIVLRIESPGGDGAAGDSIWREVSRAAKKKPVIASMGDVAASAGYLVAAPATAIVAEPSTITGSIGVFAVKPDLSGLLEKLTVRRETALRGENADITSVLKPFSPSERAAAQKAIDAFYASFVQKVAEGRGLPRADVEAIAGGRVWSGKAARERRLVDRLGSLEDAVALAREKAGLGPDSGVLVRRGGDVGVGLAAGPLAAMARTVPAVDALTRAAALVPELSALAVLSELGPVLAMPEEWVVPGLAGPAAP
ncbi:MAG: signal peptide peptidase SppA [Anaeromyxobacteraceae bacterium]